MKEPRKEDEGTEGGKNGGRWGRGMVEEESEVFLVRNKKEKRKEI